MGTISEAYPHLIFDRFTSQLGERAASILKHLFPVPKDDSKRVVTLANREDYISFRHHTYATPRGPKSAELTEVGRGRGRGVFWGRGGAGRGGAERDERAQGLRVLLPAVTVGGAFGGVQHRFSWGVLGASAGVRAHGDEASACWRRSARSVGRGLR